MGRSRKRRLGSAILLTFLCISTIFAISRTALAESNHFGDSGSDISIVTNGKKVDLPLPPLVVGDRILIPLRAVSETIGADATWDEETRTIHVEQGTTTTFLLWPDLNCMKVNDALKPMEVPPRIIDGRTYVSLRFLSEALGDEVTWDSADRTAKITVSGKIPAVSPSQKTSLEWSIFGINVGDKEAHIREKLGEPSRIDPGEYGYDWWIYNADPLRLVMVGVGKGTVKTIFTTAKEALVGGISIGDNLKTLKRRYPLTEKVQVDIPEGTVEYELTDEDRQTRPLWLQDGVAAIFYIDKHLDSRISGIRLLDVNQLWVEPHYSYHARLRRSISSLPEPFLQAKKAQPILQAYERQILDLTNGVRKTMGQHTLVWSEGAARVIGSHNRDMIENRYFGHVSPSKGTLGDRLQSAGVDYELAGENLAMGQADAIEAIFGWLTSEGHRENLLNDKFREIGVGVDLGKDEEGNIVRYYGQNFLVK
ncbi:hypothetical protein GJ688_18645 [Heliobacillus mobilis]|uniref:Cysteine-rich secretory protein family protein n=1 Tax=Heliobacterium mobile TaxID=28064 RepID=A0A6I3SPW8_HELMO|nr:stalk domain-containing protein [Heliobacterium mobile]MTV50939.1 hypothetical protein [Heliobacterium mobile]